MGILPKMISQTKKATTVRTSCISHFSLDGYLYDQRLNNLSVDEIPDMGEREAKTWLRMLVANIEAGEGFLRDFNIVSAANCSS